MKTIAPSKIIFWALTSIKLLKISLTNWMIQTWQPKVKTKHDKNGNFYFQVYDPVSRQHVSLASEKEVRIWLEQRYYQVSKYP